MSDSEFLMDEEYLHIYWGCCTGWYRNVCLTKCTGRCVWSVIILWKADGSQFCEKTSVGRLSHLIVRNDLAKLPVSAQIFKVSVSNRLSTRKNLTCLVCPKLYSLEYDDDDFRTTAKTMGVIGVRTDTAVPRWDIHSLIAKRYLVNYFCFVKKTTASGKDGSQVDIFMWEMLELSITLTVLRL